MIKALFPALDHIAESIEEKTIKKEWACNGTVLMVDDEETVLAVGKAMLKKLGLNVLTAEDGLIALEVFKKHKDEISCVVLDLTMPHMNGEETFRELMHALLDGNAQRGLGCEPPCVATRRLPGETLTRRRNIRRSTRQLQNAPGLP